MSSYVIIGVHGLANKPPKTTHAMDWKNAIVEGLARNCSLKINEKDLNFQLVYWADKRYTSPSNPDEEPYIATPENQAIKKYRDNWLDEFRATVLDVVGDAIELGKKWFGQDIVSSEVLRNKLEDLNEYYNDPDFRRDLRDLVKNEIKNHPDKRILLICHSMGSIIAYDALRELGHKSVSCRVENFVTIGSPLGLPTVCHKISEEWTTLRTPSVVRNWTNFADPRDPVSFDIHLKDDYDENDFGVKVQDDLILNNYVDPKGSSNYHKIYGYLRCPEMSELIRKVL